jgi:hypothetical protein
VTFEDKLTESIKRGKRGMYTSTFWAVVCASVAVWMLLKGDKPFHHVMLGLNAFLAVFHAVMIWKWRKMIGEFKAMMPTIPGGFTDLGLDKEDYLQ